MNHKSCIEDIIIGNVLGLFQFRELQRACDCTGAKLKVSQRLKSLRGIVVRNYGFSKTIFFVVCDDIWIAICLYRSRSSLIERSIMPYSRSGGVHLR